MENLEEGQLSVPLNPEAHSLALEFAKEQRNPKKGKKVYLNTLAIYAVHSFLKWLQIESDLTQGESWNPALRALFDVADLVLPGLGKLECRPILPEENDCLLPIEVTDDRIGYVGVKMAENLQEVYLVGFIPEIDSLEPPERLAIPDFQPIEALAEKIRFLQSATSSASTTGQEQTVDLRRWFENIFEAGWQPVEALLGRRSGDFASAMRSAPSEISAPTIKRAYLIEFSSGVIAEEVILVVVLGPPQKGPEIKVTVEVHAIGIENCLPSQLHIALLDQEQIPVMTPEVRSNDNNIKFDFTALPGERFSVMLALEDVSAIKFFMI